MKTISWSHLTTLFDPLRCGLCLESNPLLFGERVDANKTGVLKMGQNLKTLVTPVIVMHEFWNGDFDWFIISICASSIESSE